MQIEIAAPKVVCLVCKWGCWLYDFRPIMAPWILFFVSVSIPERGTSVRRRQGWIISLSLKPISGIELWWSITPPPPPRHNRKVMARKVCEEEAESVSSHNNSKCRCITHTHRVSGEIARFELSLSWWGRRRSQMSTPKSWGYQCEGRRGGRPIWRNVN